MVSRNNKCLMTLFSLYLASTVISPTASLANDWAPGSNNTATGTASIAGGSYNTASGDYSISIGRNNTTSGTDAIGYGILNNVSANTSSAFGKNNTISNSDSLAVGAYNTVSGQYSSAVGSNNFAGGMYSVAIGLQNNAERGTINEVQSGQESTAVGVGNIASGYQANAIGFGTIATGTAASAFGVGAEAHHTDSTAIGHKAITTQDYQLVLGTETDTITAQGVGQAQGDATTDRFVTTDASGNLESVSLNDLYNALPRAIPNGSIAMEKLDQDVQDQITAGTKGVAMSFAMSNVPHLSDPNREGSFGVGLGFYEGVTAISLAANARFEDDAVGRVSIATDTKGTFGFGAGVSWEW